MKSYNILTINPGSTSTKISYFKAGKEILKNEISHDGDLLKTFNKSQELEYRLQIIKDIIDKNDIALGELHAIVGRGGILKPLSSGTYIINEKMIQDLTDETYGRHASNLGGILAKQLADKLGIPSYIVDPVVVDEMEDIARISGIPEIARKSIFHALNQKAVAKNYAKDNNLDYKKLTLIIAHMGGGISIGLHYNGKVIDVNNALDGEGPFSPERSGSIPIGDFYKLDYTKQFNKQFLLKRIKGSGGVMAYLNTNNIKEVVERIDKGDDKAKLIIDAMCYQIAKSIGALATITNGKIDQIILTGGMAYSKYITSEISKRVNFITGLTTIAGENEMISLYQGGLCILSGKELPKEYK